MTNKDKPNDAKYDKDNKIIIAPKMYDMDPDKYHINTSEPTKKDK